MHMDRNESSFVFANDSLVLWRKVYDVFVIIFHWTSTHTNNLETFAISNQLCAGNLILLSIEQK